MIRYEKGVSTFYSTHEFEENLGICCDTTSCQPLILNEEGGTALKLRVVEDQLLVLDKDAFSMALCLF